MKRNLDVFNNEKILKSALENTNKNYRPFDPGQYLYKQVMNYKGKRYSRNHIELIYVTLSAWNMNSRGARLNDFELFQKTIQENKSLLDTLNNQTILNLDISEQNLHDLFFSLKLVYENKPILVTFAKTLHFLFPELITPIDRKYTLNYFYNNKNIPSKYPQNQWQKFIEIEKEFCRFANKNKKILDKYKNDIWSLNIPKIIDNMIIGYLKNNFKN